MPCAAQLVPFQLLGMTSCGISLLTSYAELRDLTADLLSEVCHDVRIEPHLQSLTGDLSHIPLLMLKRMPAWMLGHVAFGDYDNRVHFLM